MVARVVAATFAGGVVMFVLGFLIYGIALDAFMKANMVQYTGLIKETPDFILLGVANLTYAFLLAFIADYWARVRTFAGGAKLGAIVAFLFALTLDLMFMAFMNLYSGFLVVIVDIIASTVMGAIAGGVIGLVLGKMDNGSD